MYEQTQQVGREVAALIGIEKDRAKRRKAEQARQNQPQAKKTNGEKNQKQETVPTSEDKEKLRTRNTVGEKVGVSGKTAEQSAFCLQVMDAPEILDHVKQGNSVRGEACRVILGHGTRGRGENDTSMVSRTKSYARGGRTAPEGDNSRAVRAHGPRRGTRALSIVPPRKGTEGPSLTGARATVRRASEGGRPRHSDGHNRYEICTRLGIEFETFDVDDCSTREAAIAWIVANQLGRRNLTPSQRVALALELEKQLAEVAKLHRRATQNNDAGKAIVATLPQ